MSDNLTTAYMIGAEHMREHMNGRLLTENAELRRRITELEAALEPFAEMTATIMDGIEARQGRPMVAHSFTMDDIRAARKALGEKENE
jgi:cell division septum initiation protein DivIVA